jgi:hypothetical protein
VPFLPEVRQLQNEAHSVICLLQARQTLHRPHCIEALGGQRTAEEDRITQGPDTPCLPAYLWRVEPGPGHAEVTVPTVSRYSGQASV